MRSRNWCVHTVYYTVFPETNLQILFYKNKNCIFLVMNFILKTELIFLKKSQIKKKHIEFLLLYYCLIDSTIYSIRFISTKLLHLYDLDDLLCWVVCFSIGCSYQDPELELWSFLNSTCRKIKTKQKQIQTIKKNFNSIWINCQCYLQKWSIWRIAFATNNRQFRHKKD